LPDVGLLPGLAVATTGTPKIAIVTRTHSIDSSAWRLAGAIRDADRSTEAQINRAADTTLVVTDRRVCTL
jgi:hypothetical protein